MRAMPQLGAQIPIRAIPFHDCKALCIPFRDHSRRIIHPGMLRMQIQCDLKDGGGATEVSPRKFVE
jgi:hypothetical protein